jgi:hypothetical protein
VRTLAAAVAALALLAGCQPDTVRISFRPAAGAHYAYRVEIQSVTVTSVEGTAPQRVSDDFILRADHSVLAVSPASIRVRIRLAGEGLGPRTFVVRLDRAGQLVEVQRIEGLPARALGSLGLSEIFPAAAGAPPDRRISPGERWVVDEPVVLPGQPATRLRGSGRLKTLGVIDGRKVATVESTFRLAVRGTSQLSQGNFVLDGSQSTSATSTQDLSDGSVEKVEAVTTGRYRLTLLPPTGTDGPPVPGTLTIEVRSKTTRLS